VARRAVLSAMGIERMKFWKLPTDDGMKTLVAGVQNSPIFRFFGGTRFSTRNGLGTRLSSRCLSSGITRPRWIRPRWRRAS